MPSLGGFDQNGQFPDGLNKRDRYYNQQSVPVVSQHRGIDHADYRISSGRKYAAPANKNYQTFNDDDSKLLNQQQEDGERHGEDSEELSEYPGEEMGSSMSEVQEMGKTSQMSPTKSSPLKDSDFEHTRTEQIRNFMDQAQPGGSMLESQSQMGSSTFIDNRKMVPQSNPMQQDAFTEEKEGGQHEDPYGQGHYSGNNYSGALKDNLQHQSPQHLNYQRDSESSPELSGTNQMSSNSRNYASSSLADTPASPPKARDVADEQQLLTNLNINAQKITQQLNQMQ